MLIDYLEDAALGFYINFPLTRHYYWSYAPCFCFFSRCESTLDSIRDVSVLFSCMAAAGNLALDMTACLEYQLPS
jgi:hypothetical protein